MSENLVPEAVHRLPQLAEPGAYHACVWDLTQEPTKRAYWIGLFRRHFPTLLEEAQREAAETGADPAEARARCDAAQAEFFAYLDTADQRDPLDILIICHERERVLRRHGIRDAFRLAKQRENDLALKVLPRVLAEHDALSGRDRIQPLMEGVFAGNIFDLGATETAAMFQDGATVDFHQTRQRLKPRPWLFDDFDAWTAKFAGAGDGSPYRKALLFVDNAGSDVVLGMIPLARDLLKRGAEVVLTANTEPALNDITHEELVSLIARVASQDSVIREARESNRLILVPSGNWAPLIDLTRLSAELAEAAAGADLVVLEGMGRAVESNLHATLSCDALKVAMIKDRGVADALGGDLYDLVMKFEPVA